MEVVHVADMYRDVAALGRDGDEPSVDVQALAGEVVPEVFHVLAGAARNVEQQARLRHSGTNGVANPDRLLRVVLV